MVKYNSIWIDDGRIYVGGISGNNRVICEVVPMHISDVYEIVSELNLLGNKQNINAYPIETILSVAGVITDDLGNPVIIKTNIGTYVLYIKNTIYYPNDSNENESNMTNFIENVNKVVREVIMNGKQ